MGFDVVRAGTGRRLLLLHSGFSTPVEFRRLIELLSRDHEVLAPTLPGSTGGPSLDVRKSMLAEHAHYVEELLDAEGWPDGVATVGSSFGGVLALELLGRQRASTVVALAPPWVAGPALAFYAALFSAALPTIRLSRPIWPRSTRSDTINGLWFHQSLVPPQIQPEDVAVLLDSWGRFPFFRVGLHAPLRGPGMPDLSRIDSERVALVWGGRDFIVPPWLRQNWSAALPEARVVTLPGFPHQPHLRDPERIADLIRTELDRRE